MKRLLPLLLLCAPALADDPPRPAPVAATSVITLPDSPPLVFFGDKAVTKSAVKWRVKQPADAQFKQYGTVLVILNPVPGAKYTVTQTTYGDDPPVDIDQVEVTAPGTVVTPPGGGGTPPAPAPAQADALGLAAFTKATVAGARWSAESLRFQRSTLAPIFADVAGKAATYKDGNAALADLEARYKAAIGADAWPGWSASLFAPLRAQLKALAAAGKLPDVASLAEAFREIGTGLQGD